MYIYIYMYIYLYIFCRIYGHVKSNIINILVEKPVRRRARMNNPPNPRQLPHCCNPSPTPPPFKYNLTKDS